jgi:beta-lactamase superfamily II metal-dependent hydrolase
MKIVDYHIAILSVGAADAFIIHYMDENDKGYLILIDAGNYQDGQKIIDHIRKYYKNPVIDLAIVTHPGDDHYGGFIKMLEKIQGRYWDAIKINNFWINDPGNNHIAKNEVKWVTKQKSVNVRARSVYDLGSNNLIDLIDSLSINKEEKFSVIYKHPFEDYFFVPSDFDFPCFKIIGPTESYYEQLVPNFRNDALNFHEAEDDSDYNSGKDVPNGKCLSSTLDSATDDTSAHNQSSLIFLFEPAEGKQYLFMGDAGRDAFNNIAPHAKECIKNIPWIKIPHHGSKHNLDSAMINWIRPQTAYIYQPSELATILINAQ